MMDKTIHFISGLPRSGSTLLCNILAQNPQMHATGTSGILDVMFGVRNQWDNLIEFKAMADDERERAKRRVLRGIVEAFYADVDKPIIFDKSRGWLGYIELAETILERKIKVLVPVRDIADILASFEKIYRASPTFQLPLERENYFHWQTIEGRCEMWCHETQPVGVAFNRLRDALQRGLRDRLHFVEFNDLTRDPETTMRGIYNFLELDYYQHDFNNIDQVTFENDVVWGFPPGALHRIRQKVAPMRSQAREVLGDALADRYRGSEFWRKVN